MKELESDLQQSLNDNDQISTKQPTDKPKERSLSVEEWIGSMNKNCKRMFEDENYRKEVAKNQF